MSAVPPSFITSSAHVPPCVIDEIIQKCKSIDYFTVTPLEGELGEGVCGIYVDHNPGLLGDYKIARYLFCLPDDFVYDLQGGCQSILEILGIAWGPDGAIVECPLEETAIDTSANPSHYADFAVSPVDLIAAYKLPFFEGNVIKYVARARHKNGRGDLLKALWYLLWCLGLPKEKIEEMVKSVDVA